MKPGDVVIRKGKVVEKEWGSVSSRGDHLTIIEEKADIIGCVLAKDYKGEIHCINPDLFEVLWTQEEAVARKMMEPPIMQFKPVSASDVEQRLMSAMAGAMAQSIDDAVMNGMLPTADKKGTEQIRKMSGMGDR